MEYLRNVVGQVSEVDIVIGGQAPAVFATDLSYLPFGPLQSLTWANGLSLSRSFGQDYRLTQHSVGPWQATYGYDANSNIDILENGLFGDLIYDYDELDRLTQEERADLRKEYGYDAVGNRTSKTTTTLNGQVQNSTTSSLTYASDSNRLIWLDGQAVASDAAGNLTQDRADRELEYDAQGRLSKVKIWGSVAAEYRYNALGQRTHKITGSATTLFLYGPDGQLLSETRYDSFGTKLSSQYYLWLDSMPIGGLTLRFGANGAVTSTTVFYLHADHLNSPRLATNQSGQEVWRWQSDAFGDGVATSAPNSGLNAINLRFPGQYYDSESGLYYNYFRDYDPQTGRYVQSDPIGLNGGLNTYSYVEGNPLSNVDPDGLRGRPAPPIPGNLGRYPYIPDPWRKDYYRDFREGHFKSICVEYSCPFSNNNECTPDNPSGDPTTWRSGSFLSATGSGAMSGCVCARYMLEWFPGWDTPNFVRNLMGG